MKRLLLLTALAGVAVVGYFACTPPPEQGTASLNLSASPRNIDAAGQKSTLTVSAQDEKGQAGTGNVTITAPAGAFADGTTSTTVALAAGTGTTTFSCNAATDPRCSGDVKLVANWPRPGGAAAATATATVTVATSTQSDSGSDGGKTDGGLVDYTMFCAGLPQALYFDGKPNAYIFEGQQLVNSGVFTEAHDPTGAPAHVHIGVVPAFSTQGSNWSLDFSTPTLGGQLPLTAQLYPTAARYGFQGPGEGGLDVSGDGRGCNKLSGAFEVRKISVVNGAVTEFFAQFVEQCLDVAGQGPLYGCVRFTGPPGDAGTDGGGGDSGVPDAGPPDVVLALTSSKAKIYTGVGDYADLDTAVTFTDGGPFAGATITYSTTLGGVATPDGGTPSATLVTTANGAGHALARLFDSSSTGTAQITARESTTGKTATTSVDILAINQIKYVSTLCGGVPCQLMGIKGSGYNEVAQVTFSVTDASNNPVQNVRVVFSTPAAPQGTTVSGCATCLPVYTNAQGQVVATVQSGPTIGAFSVHAVVTSSIFTDSPTIGVRGAKPANHAFSFACTPVNVAVLEANNPPSSIPVTCDVRLVDRYNNKVGTGTAVKFLVENGSITNQVNTVPFDPTPGANNTSEGFGTVAFTTGVVGSLPLNVPPLAADPAQPYPGPRQAEPSYVSGSITRNPRDGLVSLVAYVQGEEWYDDANSNGQWDPGEQFIDQGEPLVDFNDNGVYDVGEKYIDTNNNNQWDGPNGVWDGNTNIWTETRVLYTSAPVAANSFLSPDPFSALCPGGLAKGSTLNVSAYFGDVNLNQTMSTPSFLVGQTATTGAVAWASGPLPDGYGMGISREKLDAATSGPCIPTSSRCVWKYLFTTWDRGYSGYLTVVGDGAAGTNPCQNTTLIVKSSILNVITQIPVSSPTGAIQ